MTLLTSLLKPSFVKNEFDSIQVNEKHNRVIMAVGYPRAIREGWLDTLITSSGNYDLSMHIEPTSMEHTLTMLNNELVKQESDIKAFEMKGIVNPSLKIQYGDTYKTLENLQKGEEKLFNFSLYVNAKAPDKKSLDLLTRKIYSEMNSILIIPKMPYLRMHDALKSVLPIRKDKLRVTRNVPSNALAACFPFTSSFSQIDEQGIMFGVNKNNQIPLIINPYNFANYNGLILGTSGGGKSFATKLLVTRNLLNGARVMVIDPQGEYTDLVKNYDGQVVEISRESDTIINPLDLLGQDYGEKMLSLMDLFKIMFGELTEAQKGVLDKALEKVYRDRGIFANDKKTWERAPPILSDLYRALEEEKKEASRIEEPTYEALMNRLRVYAKGTFSFLNRETHLDLDKDFISFNILEMPPQVKPIMMYLILDFIHKRMQNNLEKKLLVIDEAWSLLRHGEHANHVFEMIKTARKFNLGILIITQEVNDLVTSKAGNTILANTAWKLLLRQEPSVIKDLSEKFNLNQEEQKTLLTATEGEGLLFAMNDRLPIKVIASETEHELITTNPQELLEKQKTRDAMLEEKTQENLEIYKLSKPFYEKNVLTELQTEFLKSQGYLEYRDPEFGEGRGKNFLVCKPPPNESLPHHFMVQLLKQEIKKHTDKVITLSTGGPDLQFWWKEKKYAIEVETGTVLEDHKERLLEKAALLAGQCQEWFFVVTNKALKPHYQNYGPTYTRTEVKEKLSPIFTNQ
ncbi:MAG TPA: ATP-binding protein [archaeon]|nr:ATP-binding protein [archaeon]